MAFSCYFDFTFRRSALPGKLLILPGKMLEMCLFVLRQEERSLGLSIWIILLTSSKRMRTTAIVNVKPWREYFYHKTRLIFKVKSLTLKMF